MVQSNRITDKILLKKFHNFTRFVTGVFFLSGEREREKNKLSEYSPDLFCYLLIEDMLRLTEMHDRLE